MKRVLLIAMILALCVAAFAEDERQKKIDETVQRLRDAGLLDDMEDEEADDEYMAQYLETYRADNERKDEVCLAFLEKLSQCHEMLKDAALNNVEVNPNMGTDEGGDFIAQVDVTYAKKSANPKDDYNMLVKISANISVIAEMAGDDICELVVYWKLPLYDSQAKVTFERKDGGLRFGEHAMFPRVMVE